MANLGAQSLVIPPYTKLGSMVGATISSVVGLDPGASGLRVSVDQILTEQSSNLADPSNTEHIDELCGEIPERFNFSDGTEYRCLQV